MSSYGSNVWNFELLSIPNLEVHNCPFEKGPCASISLPLFRGISSFAVPSDLKKQILPRSSGLTLEVGTANLSLDRRACGAT